MRRLGVETIETDSRNDQERVIGVPAELASETQMEYTPTTMVLNGRGRITWIHVGALSDGSALEASDALARSFPLLVFDGLRSKSPVLQDADDVDQAKKTPTLASKQYPFDLRDAPVLGSPAASVTIVEFVDYQCPFCARALSELGRFVSDHSGRVRLVIKQFPLTSIHQHAEHAALAALAFDRDERFWQMHQRLFAAQRDLSDRSIEAVASSVFRLKPSQIRRALAQPGLKTRLSLDVQEAVQAQVNGTPTLFVNGHLYSGPIDQNSLSQAISPLFR